MKYKYFNKNIINKFNILKIKNGLIELKNKIITLLLYLIIFRIGSFIPIPNININIILNNLYKNIKEGYIINMFNLFSGGSLRRASIFSLGMVPYITSSMIIEILCITFDYFKKLKSDSDENNRYKINKYIYLCTLFLSLLQSIITIFSLPKLFYIENSLKFNFNYKNIILSILSLITGTMFLTWLSNQITINGIGNGVSIIMFSEIISKITENIINIFNQVRNNCINIYSIMLLIFISFLIINFIIFIECGQRNIIVNFYKKYNYKEKIFNIQSIYLPMKVNILGVTPIMFTSSFMLLLMTIINYMEKIFKHNFLLLVINSIYSNIFIYNIIHICMIFLFCNLYSPLVFNCKDISENFKKIGAYIFSIRPGNQTYIYIKKISNKLALVNSFYISILFVIPNLIKNIINYPVINSTYILIVVSVILEIINQIETIVISNQYDFF